MESDGDLYSRIIYKTDHFQIRITVNRFRGIEYLHIRKYYLDFNEEWLPSTDGISMPLEINSSQELFAGLVEILSLAESKELISQNFRELLEEIYQ